MKTWEQLSERWLTRSNSNYTNTLFYSALSLYSLLMSVFGICIHDLVVSLLMASVLALTFTVAVLSLNHSDYCMSQAVFCKRQGEKYALELAKLEKGEK